MLYKYWKRVPGYGDYLWKCTRCNMHWTFTKGFFIPTKEK